MLNEDDLSHLFVHTVCLFVLAHVIRGSEETAGAVSSPGPDKPELTVTVPPSSA